LRRSSQLKATTTVILGIVLAVSTAVLLTVFYSGDSRIFPTVVHASGTKGLTIGSKQDPRVIERGRVYYVQVCLPCHGARGDGLGEWAYRVAPRPADLRLVRTQRRSNQELFHMISAGIKGTAMIGWQRQLSVAQRWQIVAYLRYLGSQHGGRHE